MLGSFYYNMGMLYVMNVIFMKATTSMCTLMGKNLGLWCQTDCLLLYCACFLIFEMGIIMALPSKG